MCWFNLMGPRHRSGVLVKCMYSGLAGGLPFVAHVALLACIGELEFIVCVCVCVPLVVSCLLMHS